ncbi:MAG TPA: class I SAM-dependent methyltransferase [Candidatus Diapherotrites archaeon]|uniref:Class I SAM-dependent methyltransferase n=1 Tax=Candidatus Iainarchaeum sp. TaxID=3101447 RepID=A0A7J4KUI4_9ARCH|nr:class I SAM-dependent methyltransferase [Candidatus Diapherotrites archaeon]
MKDYKGIEGDYYEKAHFEGHKAQKFHYESREEFLLELLDLEKKDNCLEIGCGSGVLSRKIQEKFRCWVTGTDISRSAIRHARKFQNKNLEFKVAGISKLPFKDEEFDAVVISHLIEHVENPGKALLEAKRVLKKNGKILIATPNYFSPWPIAEWVFDKVLAKKGYSLQDQHISKFDAWSTEKALRLAGFEVNYLRTLYILSMPASLFSTRISKALFKIDKLLSKLPLGMVTYAVAFKK